MIKVLFYLSKKRTNQRTGKAPVYCRITYNSKRASDFSTGIFALPENWQDEHITSAGKEAEMDNLTLDEMKARIKSIWLDLDIRKQPISAEIVKNIFNGRMQSRKNFLEIADEFLLSENKTESRASGTIKKNERMRTNVGSFLKSIGRPHLIPEEFNIKLASNYIQWLHENLKSCGKTNSARNAEFCKRVLRFAVCEEYIPYNPLESLKTKRDKPKEIVHLTHQELQKLIQYQFQSVLLQQVAHLYLFQCGNGFSYGDLYTEFTITDGANGFKFFNQKRHKNGSEFCVPLFPLSNHILLLYKGNLPVVSNTLYNRALKEIAAIIGINKTLTTHTARKTFATLKDSEGWSTESISRMLGHTTVRTTETHYINTSEKRIVAEMVRLGLAG